MRKAMKLLEGSGKDQWDYVLSAVLLWSLTWLEVIQQNTK